MIILKMKGNIEKSKKMQFWYYNCNCANMCLDSCKNLDVLTLVYFDKVSYQKDVLAFEKFIEKNEVN